MHYPARAALERKKTAIFVFWRPQNAGFSMGNLITNQGRRSCFNLCCDPPSLSVIVSGKCRLLWEAPRSGRGVSSASLPSCCVITRHTYATEFGTSDVSRRKPRRNPQSEWNDRRAEAYAFGSLVPLKRICYPHLLQRRALRCVSHAALRCFSV